MFFFLLDRTLIYHEIGYIDLYLDSMEREVEGGFLPIIQHCIIRNYEMKNEYLYN